MERRLRFSEVDIQGWAEEATVKRKNIISKLRVQKWPLVDGIVLIMTLCIVECPNGEDGIKKIVDDREKVGFVKHLCLTK